VRTWAAPFAARPARETGALLIIPTWQREVLFTRVSSILYCVDILILDSVKGAHGSGPSLIDSVYGKHPISWWQ
jgi:hypothetical protein